MEWYGCDDMDKHWLTAPAELGWPIWHRENPKKDQYHEMVLIFRNQVDYRLISVIWKVSLILGRELQRTCMFPTFHPSLPLLGAFKTNCFCFLLPLEFLIEHGMCFYDLIFHCGCWVVSLKLNKLMWGLSFYSIFFVTVPEALCFL